MRKLLLLFYLIIILGCNQENSGDCFQTAGAVTRIEITVPDFQKITVHERIELFISEGDEQKVIVESGKNLLPDISVEVINNELVLKNFNTCNFFREYDLTKIYVTAPNINTIRNASEQNVNSEGVLNYANLYLISLGEKNEFLPVGNWHLTIQNQSLRILSNGIANFYIKGKTNNLDINFSTGDTRFEGKELVAQHIKLNQTSSNDMLIFPVQSLKGSIRSTGDVISFNRPPIVEIEDLTNYGELIFK